MVHTSQLERIRQARDAEGKRPCRIPCVDARLEKEQRLKTATGNYGCLVCGTDDFSWSQYRAWLQSAAKADVIQPEATSAG